MPASSLRHAARRYQNNKSTKFSQVALGRFFSSIYCFYADLFNDLLTASSDGRLILKPIQFKACRNLKKILPEDW